MLIKAIDHKKSIKILNVIKIWKPNQEMKKFLGTKNIKKIGLR